MANGSYAYTGTIQKLTEYISGVFSITGYGGQGGGGFLNAQGGKGAEVSGNFNLQAGETLEIIVGGAGAFSRGGGGGASIVLADVDAQGNLTPGTYSQVLLVAAGGGGANTGIGGGNGSAATGAAGGAGGAAANPGGGGGGAGLKNNGGTAGNASVYTGGSGGRDVAIGSTGGTAGFQGGRGGFGGGGGGGFYGGGGGGGYTGGGGGGGNGRYGAGGGGTSFDAGTAVAARTISGQNAGNGKVVVTCFATGTLIRVMREAGPADIAVEALAVGDIAITSSGEHRQIRWVGHRTHRLQGTLQPRAAWPVRVAAHAFGDTRPDRDLYLSPGHSVCVTVIDEALIPVQELVNGSTIAYAEMDEITYWHVELETHDILLANNLPAESFLEMGANRALIDDAAAPDLPLEVLQRTHADFCRPLVDGGPLLAVLRQRLEERAERLGWTQSQEIGLCCTAGKQELAPIVRGGEAFVALPPGEDSVTLRCRMMNPALLGGCDARRLGLAVYALEMMDAGGEVRALDLDSPDLAACFHGGERVEQQHYRWSAGDIVVPGSARAGLAGPVTLRLAFESSTLRGWIEPEHRPHAPKLRIVGAGHA